MTALTPNLPTPGILTPDGVMQALVAMGLEISYPISEHHIEAFLTLAHTHGWNPHYVLQAGEGKNPDRNPHLQLPNETLLEWLSIHRSPSNDPNGARTWPVTLEAMLALESTDDPPVRNQSWLMALVVAAGGDAWSNTLQNAPAMFRNCMARDHWTVLSQWLHRADSANELQRWMNRNEGAPRTLTPPSTPAEILRALLNLPCPFDNPHGQAAGGGRKKRDRADRWTYGQWGMRYRPDGMATLLTHMPDLSLTPEEISALDPRRLSDWTDRMSFKGKESLLIQAWVNRLGEQVPRHIFPAMGLNDLATCMAMIHGEGNSPNRQRWIQSVVTNAGAPTGDFNVHRWTVPKECGDAGDFFRETSPLLVGGKSLGRVSVGTALLIALIRQGRGGSVGAPPWAQWAGMGSAPDGSMAWFVDGTGEDGAIRRGLTTLACLARPATMGPGRRDQLLGKLGEDGRLLGVADWNSWVAQASPDLETAVMFLDDIGDELDYFPQYALDQQLSGVVASALQAEMGWTVSANHLEGWLYFLIGNVCNADAPSKGTDLLWATLRERLPFSCNTPMDETPHEWQGARLWAVLGGRDPAQLAQLVEDIRRGGLAEHLIPEFRRWLDKEEAFFGRFDGQEGKELPSHYRLREGDFARLRAARMDLDLSHAASPPSRERL